MSRANSRHDRNQQDRVGGDDVDGIAASPHGAVPPETADGPSGSPSEATPPRGHSLPSEIATLPSANRRDELRIVEARLFASDVPLGEAALADLLPEGADIKALLEELKAFYAGRGINLMRVAGKWAFRTAEDLAFVLEKHAVEERRLSKAALETLAIIAYHQPVTRAEIEDVRGVSISKGTLDVLMETGWVRPRGRRRAPGRPITYGTTDGFLNHFGLEKIDDLPGMAELKAAGLLDATLPPDFRVPEPQEIAALMPDELPLEDEVDEDEIPQTDLFDGDDWDEAGDDAGIDAGTDTGADASGRGGSDDDEGADGTEQGGVSR